MNHFGFYLLILIIGYFCGCIQSGYFVGKVNGIDIRDYGSGNAGSTNVLRVLGKGWAAVTFLGDFFKGFIPVMIVGLLVAPKIPGVDPKLAQLIIGFGAVLGHDYPFFLKFKGGKGVATSAAVMTAFDWRMGLISVIIFLIVVVLTRYVSLGSCLVSIGFLVEMAIFQHFRPDLMIMTFLYTFFIIYRHRTNIQRLLSGTESKIGQKVEIKK